MHYLLHASSANWVSLLTEGLLEVNISSMATHSHPAQGFQVPLLGLRPVLFPGVPL
jgi:hypothetical protein